MIPLLALAVIKPFRLRRGDAGLGLDWIYRHGVNLLLELIADSNTNLGGRSTFRTKSAREFVGWESISGVAGPAMNRCGSIMADFVPLFV